MVDPRVRALINASSSILLSFSQVKGGREVVACVVSEEYIAYLLREGCVCRVRYREERPNPDTKEKRWDAAWGSVWPVAPLVWVPVCREGVWSLSAVTMTLHQPPVHGPGALAAPPHGLRARRRGAQPVVSGEWCRRRRGVAVILAPLQPFMECPPWVHRRILRAKWRLTSG